MSFFKILLLGIFAFLLMGVAMGLFVIAWCTPIRLESNVCPPCPHNPSCRLPPEFLDEDPDSESRFVYSIDE